VIAPGRVVRVVDDEHRGVGAERLLYPVGVERPRRRVEIDGRHLAEGVGYGGQRLVRRGDGDGVIAHHGRERREVRLLCATGEQQLVARPVVSGSDLLTERRVAAGRDDVAQLLGIGVELGGRAGFDPRLREHDVGVVFEAVEEAL